MKIGILGAGGMGNVHARAYAKMPDVEVHFHDRRPDRAEAFSEIWGHQSHPTVESLMDTVDGVDICLPTDLHHEYAIPAIKAGKAVFCEKPMTRSLDEALSLVEAVNEHKSAFMPGQVARFFPDFKKCHDMVEKGGVGRPAAIRVHRGGATPKGSELWFTDHSRSGGVLLDLAIHDFDWIRWTFGEVKHLYSRSVAAEKGSGPDYALTVLTLESGAVAHVESTWMDPAGFRTTIEVSGSDGLISHDTRANASLRVYTSEGTRFEANFDPLDDPYYCELRAWVDAASKGTPLPVTVEDGFYAVSIALAALESAQTGRVIKPQRL